MQATIVASALLLGLAGSPHCTAMCAAPCAALVGRDGPMRAALAFHLARIAGYAAAGAAAAGGLAVLAGLSQVAPMLRPLWTMVHAGLFALGLWLLWQGRQPAWLANVGRQALPATASPGWQPLTAPALVSQPAAPARLPDGRHALLRAGLAGSLWFAWPCGLLQSALLVAALADSAAGGALAMAAFASASSAGLVLAPLLWRRLGRAGTGRAETWALRLAGALMAALSGWALTAGLWQRVAEYCATLLS